MKKKSGWMIALLLALVGAGVISKEWFCKQYPDQAICAPSPEPTVAPTPTPEPTLTPTPKPEPKCMEGQNCDCYAWVDVMDRFNIMTCTAPAVCVNHVCTEPEPTPTPTPVSACPKPLAPGAKVYVVNKKAGQGIDRTTRVFGDPEFCRLIHGVSVNDCHLEGWPRREACEMELEGGCDEWQFSINANGAGAIPCNDDQHAPASCDHFGNVEFRDDPKTPTTGDTLATLKGFEGRPLECGLQRNAFGPNAGMFMVGHGDGYFRACPPRTPLNAPSSGGPGRPTGPCGQWVYINH